MSDSALWQWVKQGRRGACRRAFSIVAVTLAIAAAACGSPAPAPALTSTPEPAQVPVQPPPTALPALPAVPTVMPSMPSRGVAASQFPAIADLVEGMEPSVASISVESVNQGMFFDFTNEGAGTGIVIRPDGYVVTNYHVVQDVVGIKVNMPNGRTYDAEIVGWDIVSDLAVLKVETEDDLPVISWGDSDELRVGDWVVAVGNALALKGGPTVTMGIISAKGRTVRTDRGALYDMIQTDAAINDGNSGGPLMNMSGEVVGISTAMLRQAQGIGFAISSETALPIIDSLIEHGRVVRPLMGLNAEDVTPAIANRLGLNVTEGIIITRMSQGGPAYEAGLQVGDVVTSMDGIPTSDMSRFLTLLWSYDIGDTVNVEYMRENKAFETSIQLAERFR